MERFARCPFSSAKRLLIVIPKCFAKGLITSCEAFFGFAAGSFNFQRSVEAADVNVTVCRWDLRVKKRVVWVIKCPSLPLVLFRFPSEPDIGPDSRRGSSKP